MTLHLGWELPKTLNWLKCFRSRRGCWKPYLPRRISNPHIVEQMRKVMLGVKALESSEHTKVRVYDPYLYRFQTKWTF